MRKKFLILLCLSLCHILSSMAQADDVFTDGLVKYTTLTANTVSATWLENNPEDVVVIPASIEHDGQTFSVANVDFNNDTLIYQLVISEGISSIIANASGDCPSLKRLDLPGSLKEILYGWFSNFKGLEEVSLGEGLESLDQNCFRSSHLRRLTIPASVKTVGPALCCVDKIEEIIVHPDSPYYYSQDNTLVDKSKAQVVLGNPDLFIPNDVTSIGTGAYCMYYNSYQDLLHGQTAPRDLTIPQNISRLSLSSFMVDSLSTLCFPNTTTLDIGCVYFRAVKEIIIEDGDSPFYYTPLMADEGALRFESYLDPKVIETMYIGRNKRGEGSLFEGYQSLTVHKMIIGPKVTEYTENNKYAIKELYSLCNEPEKVTVCFSDVIYTNTPLYVPVGTKDRYLAAEGWKNFQTIEEKENMPTGISAIHSVYGNNGSCYNLQGQQQKTALQKGIYIQNGKKIVMK